MASYITPYRGGGASLPAGFMQQAGSIGDRYAAGIESGTNAIAQAMERRTEEAKKEAEAGKAAETFIKILGDKSPIPHDEFKNLSARDKASVVAGMMQEQGYQRGLREAQSSALNQKYVGAQLDVMQQRAAQEKATLERANAFNEALKSRLTMPEGQQGPVAPVSGQELLQIMSKTGMLMNAESDNVLNAVTKMQGQGTSRAGTVQPMEGGNFIWQSDTGGTFFPNKPTNAGVAQEPPPGYSTWDDGTGKLKLVKLPAPNLSTEEKFLLGRLPQDEAMLSSLLEQQARGVKKVDIGEDMSVKPSTSWFGGNAVGDMIASVKARINKAHAIRDALGVQSRQAPTPAAQEPSKGKGSFDDFLKWKAGNGK